MLNKKGEETMQPRTIITNDVVYTIISDANVV